MGGLGKTIGFPRSKVHINRPNMAQILLKMKTSNRILVSFGEELENAHSLTRKQLQKSPKEQRKLHKKLKEEIDKKIIDVQMADNIDVSKTKGSFSDSFVAKSSSPSLVDAQETEKQKKPVEYQYKKIEFEPYTAPKSEEDSFRSWALSEREKRNQVLQQASFQQSKQEREMNQVFPKIREKRKKKFQKCKVKNPIAGYLYGSFTKSLEFDHAMNKQTKFGVPLSMFTRASQDAKVRSIYRKKLQLSRLEYMKIPTIPSDSESEEDVMEDIKNISLVRTPFNTRVPKITTKRVKRMDRLKSKYLTGNRLKRVGLLLFDDSTPVQLEIESEASVKVEETLSRPGSSEISRTSDTSIDHRYHDPSAEVTKIFDDNLSAYRKDFRVFLTNKYLEKLQQYNDKLNQKLISFEEFRESEITSSAAATIKPSIFDRKSLREISSETSINVSLSTPDPSFKKVKRTVKKNARLSGYDSQTGPFYIDPFLLEKIHNPEKGKF